MEAILLPTDFSSTAENAAHYALQLAKQLGVQKLVLYHSYEIAMTVDPIAPALQMLDLEPLKEASRKNLDLFAGNLRAASGDIQLVTISEYGALMAGLDEICSQNDAGLVVMGITGGTLLEEKLIGSNTLSVAKNTKVPVIIVPAKARFKEIEKIMFTGDFNKNDTSLPLEQLRNILAETHAKLLVFDLEEKKDPAISYALHKQLDELDPDYHYAGNKNYTQTINEFVAELSVNLVITVLKKHGFFEKLFAEDHAKMLAFHSNVPLMLIHRDND